MATTVYEREICVGDATKRITVRKNIIVHVTISVENAGRSATFKCVARPNRLRNVPQTANQASFAEIAVKNPKMEGREEIHGASIMYVR